MSRGCATVHEHNLVDVDASVAHAKSSGIWHCSICGQIYVKDFDTVDGVRRSAASSFKNAKPGEKHHQGKLSSRSAWCAEKMQGPHWYQCDLGKIFLLRGILTRGRADADQWCTKLKISLSLDGIAWTQIGTDFDANFDRESVCVLSLSRSLHHLSNPAIDVDADEVDNFAGRRDLGSKHVEISRVKWHVKKGFDSFPGHDSHVIKDDASLKSIGGIDEMRRIAIQNGWGGFVVVHDKVAYFRAKSGAELIAAAKPSAPHVSIHTCLPVGASPPSHSRLLRNGYARFVRVHVVSYHVHPSLRMSVMVDRSALSPPSRRCSKGCDFDVCHRCASILSMRRNLCRKHPSLTSDVRQVCVQTAEAMGCVARASALADAAVDLALRARSSAPRAATRRGRKFTWTCPQDVVPLLSVVTEAIDVANTRLLRDDDDGVQRGPKHLHRMKILVKEVDERNRAIVQISSLRQSSDNNCGYYALYNARCLARAATAKTPLHCIASLLSMFDGHLFQKWYSEHHNEVMRAAASMLWSEKNAKDGVLGANECDFVVQRDPMLRQACRNGMLIAMHAFADCTLNSHSQLLAIDRTIREFRTSLRNVVLFVLGCVDHWVCFALIRAPKSAGESKTSSSFIRGVSRKMSTSSASTASCCIFNESFLQGVIEDMQRRCGDSIDMSDPRIRVAIERLSRKCADKDRDTPQILLVESENKKSVGSGQPTNARVQEIRRLKTLLLDAAQGRSIVQAALTKAAEVFISSYAKNVKSEPGGRPTTCGPQSIEWFAARRGGLSMLKDLIRSIRTLGHENDNCDVVLDASTKISLTTLLQNCVMEIAGSDVRSFGRSDSGRNRRDRGRMLASMRSRSDGMLWIEKFFRESTILLKLLGYAEKFPSVDFGPPKVPPLDLARSLCKDFVSVKMDDMLELLVAFDGVDFRGIIQRELSFRPHCTRGHALRPAVRPRNTCDICNKARNRSAQSGTSFRCSQGCDFDVCEKCWCLDGRGSVLRAVLGELRYRSFRSDAVYPHVWRSLFDDGVDHNSTESTSKESDTTATARRETIERAARQLHAIFPETGLDACISACERSGGDVSAAATEILDALSS